MYPTAHHLSIALVKQAATDESAQHKPSNLCLYLGNGGLINPCRRMKIHPRPIASIGGWLKYPVNDTAVKVDVLVKGRAEAVDEGNRAYSGLGIATRAVFAQAPFHLAQKDAQDSTLQGYITLQVIAQPLGHREYPLTYRQPGKHVIGQMRGCFDHAPCVAGRAYATSFTGKSDQEVVPAFVAVGTGETVR